MRNYLAVALPPIVFVVVAWICISNHVTLTLIQGDVLAGLVVFVGTLLAVYVVAKDYFTSPVATGLTLLISCLLATVTGISHVGRLDMGLPWISAALLAIYASALWYYQTKNHSQVH